MIPIFRIALATFFLGLAAPCSSKAGESDVAFSAARSPQASAVNETGAFRLVPEPGIFILIATAGFLFMIRRRG